MSDIVFVDTGAWFAGMVRNDQFHEAAVECRMSLTAAGERFFTSNLVINETTMLLERKAGRKHAILFLRAVMTDPAIRVLHIDQQLEHEGYRLYQKYKDQTYSITDCVSFAAMKLYRIKTAFTFDRHFTDMGFIAVPD